MVLTNVILDILDVVLTALGFIGYYTNKPVFLILFLIYYVATNINSLIYGTLKTVSTIFLATIIGAFIAIAGELNLFKTIVVALCYENALMSVLNIFITIFFTAIEFIRETFLEDNKLPELNTEHLLYADNKTVEKIKLTYIANVESYVKKKILKNCSLFLIVIVVVVGLVSGTLCYNFGYKKGFKDNQPYELDGSPTVYITPSGTKYHHKYCDYIDGSKLTLSQEEAKTEGYTPCSKYMP